MNSKVKTIFFACFLLLFAPESLFSQQLLQKQRLEVLPVPENVRFPSWSSNGLLVFQAEKAGRQQIFLFIPAKDTLIALTKDTLSNQHPVWVPGRNAVVYDAGTGKSSRLYYLNLKTKKTRLLFRRNLSAKEATFTPSRHLAVFSGYDDKTQRWQIFSYDFVYDNLNRLTADKTNCSFPVFSPDGKTIAYLSKAFQSTTNLMTINWYGEKQTIIRHDVDSRVCWTQDSWRIIFVSRKEDTFSLSSIRNTGNSEWEIYRSNFSICCPAVNMKNGKLTFSEKKGTKIQMVVLSK